MFPTAMRPFSTSDDRVLLDHLTLFVGNALRKGDAAVLLATESHRQGVLSRLHGFGVNVPQVIDQGRYFAFDAEESLATFMVSGVIDADRLLSLLSSLITSANGSTTGQHRRVAVYGECVHLLWASGNSEAAIQMERLGTRLARMYDIDVLCGYSLSPRENASRDTSTDLRTALSCS
jgi:KaiC/GvpD/RAD55 family RecA-like ATPase